MYKTFVIEYAPKTKTLAKKVEEKANELDSFGFTLVSFSTTQSRKAILVFKASKEAIQKYEKANAVQEKAGKKEDLIENTNVETLNEKN